MNFSIKRRWIAIFAVILLLGGVSFWYITRDGDEAQIVRTLRLAATIGSKAQGETAASAIGKVNRVDDCFARSCRFDIGRAWFSGELNSTEIGSMLAQVHGVFESLDIRLRDLAVTLTSPETASVAFTGEVTGRGRDGSRTHEIRDFVSELGKIDGIWKIRSLTVHDILEK